MITTPSHPTDSPSHRHTRIVPATLVSVAIMTAGRAQHFDPEILDAFLEIQEEFRGIAANFADDESDITAQAVRLHDDLGDERIEI